MMDEIFEAGPPAGEDLPIHSAAATGDTIKISECIQLGQDVNAYDRRGVPPLQHAILTGGIDCVRFLLSVGADPLQRRIDGAQGFDDDSLTTTARWNNVAILKELYERDAQELSEPLLAAVSWGSIDTVRVILEYDQQASTTQISKETILRALEDAARLWAADLVELLMPAVANVSDNETERRYAFSQALLSVNREIMEPDDLLGDSNSPACDWKKALEVTKLLVEAGGDINAKDEAQKTTPLHHALAQTPKLPKDLIIYLLENGAEVAAEDWEGVTPFQNVLAHPDGAELIRVFIDAGANPNARNSTGNSPLHFACSEFSAQLLIDLGADVEAVNDKGQLPLHTAVGSGFPEVAELLIRHRAAVNRATTDG
ncbi:ankyrin [Aaosphaeria arxii CBS 175.79]|uniref:Ankyrin n=1 Tax=Aaosphaeria arxii CBS 175.79 TaxID=1450172 RepID=A0A6A5XZG9_9PLEO|nr:ankyrin [Aaosphaeria arxii CBS 175.79]KAF2018020.1 ankyrin [Aaosphaeria arxii CBS 175.79]